MPTDPNITSLIMQMPGLGILVWLVIHFLGFLDKTRKEEMEFLQKLSDDKDKADERRDKVIEKIASEQNIVLERNSQMLGKVGETLAVVENILERKEQGKG